MESLTKHQIILLTLLVSFITSIATGIVTVALMNQAPIGVCQTINRIVQRTIEQVVATSTPSNSTQSTVKETVIVSEDDQVVSAIKQKYGKRCAYLWKRCGSEYWIADNKFCRSRSCHFEAMELSQQTMG